MTEAEQIAEWFSEAGKAALSDPTPREIEVLSSIMANIAIGGPLEGADFQNAAREAAIALIEIRRS